MKFSWHHNNRRRIVNFVVRPASQSKFGVYFLSAVLATALLVGGPLLFVIVRMSDAMENADSAQMAWAASAPMLYLALANLILLGFVSFHFGFVATHRVFGPLVPLLRQLEALKQGRYEARSKLRKSDELQDLADGLNELAQNLQAQQNPEHQKKSS